MPTVWRTEEFITKIKEAVKEGELRGARTVLEEACSDTPLDTGALMGSGRIEEEGELNVLVKFGGGDIQYAIKQHEITWYNHPGGGKAKYLEDAFNRLVPEILNNIKSSVEAV